MRSRALTETVQRPDVSVLVEQFCCQSHSVSNQIGANASHRLWRVRAIGHGTDATENAETLRVGEAEPLPQINSVFRGVTMEVITDAGVGGMKAKMVGTQVTIKSDGNQLFPDKMSGTTKGKLHDDWMRDWKFRSVYPGVGLVRPGEVWVPGTVPTDVPSQVGDAAYIVQRHVIGDGKLNTMHEVQLQAGAPRCPAVLTKQWPNGCFEVTAFKPDERGVIAPIVFPTLHKSSIFLTATGENIEQPETILSLEVPKSRPTQASIEIEGESWVNNLGRVSPKVTGSYAMAAGRRIEIDVPKPIYLDTAQRLQANMMANVGAPMQQQEEPVRINVGARAFEHFMSGEVRRGDMNVSRLQKIWTLQLGPFATHRIVLLKKSHMVPVMTLIVDDEILVECSSPDLGGDPNMFRCKFKFMGERYVDFSIHEETKDGVPLDSKSVLTTPHQYRHVVEINYPHKAIDNLGDATLTVDGMDYGRLPTMVEEHSGGQGLCIARSAFTAQFGITIPKKVVPQDTRGTARQLAQNVVDQAGGWSAIGANASQKVQEAGQKVQEAGSTLQQLGLNAWEMMFLQRGIASAAQPPAPVSSPNPRLTSL